MSKLHYPTDHSLIGFFQNNDISQTVEVNAVEPQFNNIVIAVMIILFMIWFAVLNIGLQKIGVSIPKVVGKFFKDLKQLLQSKS
ncbi:hypothetical protein [Roseivirga misakiensis]|uniref:Uncharacterized protein n=1 Tax=Roseivirga misakiensis TaxID=1563681 RepID=A0A1E5T6U8_9BACT|nr:hypothetical protein [Roseivirga misakiensis]OEK07099.1 hypothetical protein BFP71_05425 [Roseivirga misakiensis]